MAQTNNNIPQVSVRRRGPGMGAPVEKPKNGKETFLRLISYFSVDKKRVLALLIAVSLGVLFQVMAPGLLSKAIDLITEKNFDKVGKILILMIMVYLLNSGLTMVNEVLSAKLSQRIIHRMRKELFEKIINLPLSFIDSHSHGDLMSRMTNDAQNISNTISQSLSSLVSGVLTLIGTIAIMLYYSWQLTLLSCSVIILSVLLTKYLTKYTRRYYVKRQLLLGSINGIVEEKVSYYKTITAYNQQSSVIKQFNKTSDELTHTGIMAEILGSAVGPAMNMLNNVSFVIVAVFGGYFVTKGIISVGVISAFVIYSKQFSRPINELSQLYGQILTAIAGAERIFEVLDAQPEDKTGDKIISDTKGVIEFKNVDFSYVPGKKVIDNFSLKIESGKKIALVGSTGSGKTTIINLLMRFYDIDSGEILLDGVNIKNIDCRNLRDMIGIVLQDTVLFTDTLRSNLTYAKQESDEKEILKAAKMSKCDTVAAGLAKGCDTILENSGDDLSQGQRQLVTIGRAFLSYPNILILDEATSNVDTRTEKDIQDAMYNLMNGRTSLIIAHRLSTIQDADAIVVMDKGHIVEIGNHEELLKKQGKYYNLYMTQFAGVAI